MSSFIESGHFAWCQYPKRSALSCGCRIVGYGIAFLIALSVGFFELMMSFLAESSAMKGDAFHMMTDSFIYVVFLSSAYLMYHGRNEKEVARRDRQGGLIGVWLLLIVALGALGMAVYQANQVFDGHYPQVEATLMIFVPVGTLLGSLMILCLLHILGLSHEYSEHTHDHTHDMALLHVFADCALSIVVVVAGILSLFWSYLGGVFDILATLIIGLVLLKIALDKYISITQSG